MILEQYGLIKADEAQYAALDKEYLLDTQKEPYGYACLTNDRKRSRPCSRAGRN